MNKTYIATEKDIEHNWYIVDAKDKILGRLASKVASVLKGKDKAYYTPHLDTGDSVIVINAAKIRVTGKKLKDKTYLHYSGYPGGKKEYSLENMLKKSPRRVLELAVKRMLPSSNLGRKLLKKLKIYDSETHPHKAQNPAVLEV
ncbi:MAG: 50S ribosomal protein L13 [Candidatus Omnitrophica bacterium]|nr:50S ribosomal protein L13 [Candidatus Omnitrophota bacterium]HOX54860.1 50S ribosomal protein L13 [Candidatus Omnitrophota bacterium]